MDNTLAHRVRSEAKSVRRLAGSLENYLRRNLAFRRHPSELKPLFRFYASAFMSIRKYGLLSILDIDKKDELYARNLLKELYTVKRILQLLYDKMHAAVQAETLNTPYPILLYLNKLCSSIPAMKAQNVTVGFLTAQPMMYYHYPMEKVIALSDLLRLTIDGFPAFPTSLALVGYPYTESTNPLLNCALIHELGHFAWAKLPISAQVGKTISSLSVAGIPFGNLLLQRHISSSGQAACADEVFQVIVIGGLRAWTPTRLPTRVRN